MSLLYDLSIFILHAGIRIAAFFGNHKAVLWIEGRKDWEEKIRKATPGKEQKRVWFHCASLGEFEQGRPLIEKIKSSNPSIFILLTFFSPSGYEKRKNYEHADLVCYLPVDTKRNAEKFIRLASPSLSVFIKYEFWFHYFSQLKERGVPLLLASAVFRPSQIFFKWYGRFYRNILKNVNHFFVQDKESAELLSRIGLANCTVAGDTRFDRVNEVALQKKKLDIIELFKQDEKIIIAGSTWPEDEKIFFRTLSTLKKHKFKVIIAPHEVNQKRIQDISEGAKSLFKGEEIDLYSNPANLISSRILIIDNIGLLLHIYSYCEIAWIGGGFGKGIHNILEAAAFGLPVLIGPGYEKFREAKELVSMQGAFEIKNEIEASGIISKLLNDDSFYNKVSRTCNDYVRSNTGATDQIISKIDQLLG